MQMKLVAVAAGTAILVSFPAFAAPKGGASGQGASSFTPHAQFITNVGPLNDSRPGASGFTPGYQMHQQTGTPALHGASSFAPGHQKKR